MSRLSPRAGKNRLALIAGLAVAFVATWIYFSNPSVTLVGEDRVEATVVEVLHDKSNPSGVGIVVVELADSGRAKVFAPLAQATVGTRIPLKVKYFSDGTREVLLGSLQRD